MIDYQKRARKFVNMKTCVYIPTIPKHYQYLEEIIKIYNTGRVIPDEIIIGPASNWGSVISDLPDLQLAADWQNIKILPYVCNLEVGPNRQRALYHTNSDIILYQDSDDLPHPDRVYFIKKLFMDEDIWVVNHSYLPMSSMITHAKYLLNNYSVISSDYLKNFYFPNLSYPDDAKRFNCYGAEMPWPVHAGAVCIRRIVLYYIKWRTLDQYLIKRPIDQNIYKGAYAEDFEFCMEALFKLNKSIITDLPLYYYRI